MIPLSPPKSGQAKHACAQTGAVTTVMRTAHALETMHVTLMGVLPMTQSIMKKHFMPPSTAPSSSAIAAVDWATPKPILSHRRTTVLLLASSTTGENHLRHVVSAEGNVSHASQWAFPERS
jgi:hypothetical protein